MILKFSKDFKYSNDGRKIIEVCKGDESEVTDEETVKAFIKQGIASKAGKQEAKEAEAKKPSETPMKKIIEEAPKKTRKPRAKKAE